MMMLICRAFSVGFLRGGVGGGVGDEGRSLVGGGEKVEVDLLRKLRCVVCACSFIYIIIVDIVTRSFVTSHSFLTFIEIIFIMIISVATLASRPLGSIGKGCRVCCASNIASRTY